MSTIHVKGVGKAFKSYDSTIAKALEWLRLGKRRHSLHWVLSDIDLEIHSGQSVGLIGVNGAGKSTLLKLIAGTMFPSTGEIHIEGRVSALLELGMGFHPEFTGRQNVAMGAQLYGFSREEIDRYMPEIESFAEIGDYMEKPLRTYSSGMQMRLAFSVATARRPDILIIDEALSVGDAYFQHKSFDRIRKFRELGTTLLIVSHSPAALQAICDHAIMLDSGKVVREGKPDEVLDYYNAVLADRTQALIDLEKQEDGSIRTVSGTKDVHLQTIGLRNKDNEPIELLRVGEQVNLEVVIKVNKPVDSLVIGFLIKDHLGQAIYGVNTSRLGAIKYNLEQGDELVYVFTFPANLGKGNYSVSISLSRLDSHLDGNYEWTDRALMFHVLNTDREDFIGCNWLGAKVSVKTKENTLIAESGDGLEM